MASFADISSVRLTIADPAGIIALAQVATAADLPAAPGQQTAYLVQSTGRYMVSEEQSAAPGDYHDMELLISDAQISQLIATFGVDGAPCQAYGVLAARIGAKLRLVSTSSGAESTQYVALLDAYNYYKGLAKDCTESKNKVDLNTTGRYGRTRQPRIGGGNV